MNKKQSQKSGANSTNVQAQNLIVNEGITFSEAEKIASDVFKENFIKIPKIIEKLVDERIRYFIVEFFNLVFKKDPSLINYFIDPDLQYTIYKAEEGYARTGDKDLLNLLIKLLVNRTENNQRNLLQIVLDESIKVAPLLTQQQLDTLSMILALTYTYKTDLDIIRDIDTLCTYLENEYNIFFKSLSKESIIYQHLEYAGCGIIQTGGTSIEGIFRKSYQGFFSLGFDKEYFNKEIGPVDNFQSLICPCSYDNSKIQFKFLNEWEFSQIVAKSKIPDIDMSKILNLFNQSTMAENQIKSLLISKSNFMASLFEIWENSYIRRMHLTSVGISLASVNYNIKKGESLDLTELIK